MDPAVGPRITIVPTKRNYRQAGGNRGRPLAAPPPFASLNGLAPIGRRRGIHDAPSLIGGGIAGRKTNTPAGAVCQPRVADVARSGRRRPAGHSNLRIAAAARWFRLSGTNVIRRGSAS